MYKIISIYGQILIGNLESLKKAQEEFKHITKKEYLYKKDELKIVED